MNIIGIVVACENEIITILKSKFKLISMLDEKPYKTFLYEIENKKVYVSLSGIGETSSSACTQFLITKYNVNLIFNYGACGSLRKDLNLTNVVFISKLIDVGFDTSALDNCKKHTHIELGFDDPIMNINESFINYAKNNFPSIEQVICASNNVFIDDEKEKENINKEYNASICEMEASGIYLTCLKNNVDCFFIKSVSDTVSGGKEEYEKFATLAADEALNILVNFIKNY